MRLVYLALGWCAGIVLAASAPDRLSILWAAAALSAGAALVLLWRTHRLPAVVLLAVALGGLRFSIVPQSSPLAAFNNSGGLTLEGVVIAAPEQRETFTQIRLEVDTLERAGQRYAVSGAVLIRAPRQTYASYGDRLRVTGELIAPEAFDTFSYADLLARSGVFSIMINSAVERQSSGHGSALLRTILTLRSDARTAVERALPEPAAGLLTGILIGDETGIAPSLKEDFAITGAAHIIAISGFNMVILSATVQALLRRLSAGPRFSAFAALAAIALYTAIAGANAAVVRAALMSSLLVIAGALGRRTFVGASLAFATIALSAINPTVLWDISFQLSFFAVLGLTLFTKPLGQGLEAALARLLPARQARAAGGFLMEPLVVSLAAQIMTLPLIALYFGRVSLVSVPVNLLIVPVQPLILIMGGLATLSAVLSETLSQVLYWFALSPLAWSIAVVRAFAALPNAELAFSVDGRLVALFYAVVIAWGIASMTQPLWLTRLVHAVQARALRSATLFAGASTLLLLGGVLFSRPDGLLHVWILDVGHHHAVLAQTPSGAHLLIDGGRFPTRLLTAIGDRLPFNDRTLEIIAITQPDEANFGALTAVLSRYEAGVILTNGQPNFGEAWLELLGAAGDALLTVSAGWRVEIDDGVLLEVLHPPAPPTLTEGLNDGALVLRLSYGDVSFLFPGDLSTSGQSALLTRGIWPLAAVLQLPQHGTARSLEAAFLAAVQPQVIVVQADRANRRGDPDPDVLSRVAGLPIFRTDRMGTIHLWTDGRELWSISERR